MITSIGKKAAAFCEQIRPWSNVYGVARSVLATSTLLTLLLNDVPTLFRPASGIPNVPVVVSIGRFSIFALLAHHLNAARLISIFILLAVVIGWRPRWTGLLHWWVTFSLQASAINIDGGDQIASMLTFFLVPVALTDGRRWHWTSPAIAHQESTFLCVKQLLAISSLIVIRIQVAAIYFHSSVAKMKVEEWADGTALYYWFSHPMFGAPPWMRPLLDPLLRNGVTIALLTWGAIAFEFLLFMALIMPKRYWAPLMIAGMGFHLAIALIHGLVSFSLIMSAALILYLRPAEQPFSMRQSARGWRSAFAARFATA